MTQYLFSNGASTTVSSGGTTAPASGTSESWTVTSSTGFPAASSSASPLTSFAVSDPAATSEVMIVTNVSGTTWTVTRGAEGTTPVAHTSGFTVKLVVTSGYLQRLSQFPSDWISVKEFGAAGNGAITTGASMTSGSATLTNATAVFSSADVGKLAVVQGAGTSGAALSGTISSVQSSTSATLSVSAATTVSSATAAWGSDDASAIQNAINAAGSAGRTVIFPDNGIYVIGSALLVENPIRLTGDGSTILTTQSGAINFNNTYISASSSGSTTIVLEIDHLVFDVTGGHIFSNTNINGFDWHHLRLVVRDANHGAWNSSNSTANQLTGSIRNSVIRVYGSTRSVEAFYVLSSIGGGMAFVTHENLLFQNANSDTTQFFVHYEGTGTHNYTNAIRFIQCTFDSAYGGCVRLLSTQGSSFYGCNIVDTFNATPGNSMYYIGASTGGSAWASQKVSFRDMSRDLQGPNGSSTWDIYLESTTDSVTVDIYEVRDIPGTATFYPYFNFNGATNVLVSNCPDAQITNAASTGETLGPNGNLTVTGTITGNVSATPENQYFPSDVSLISWAYDPVLVSGTGTLNVGKLYFVSVLVNAAATISDVVFTIGTAGATLTTGENYVGLYNSSGTLLSGSADMTTTFGGTGTIAAALTTAQNVSAGTYLVALLSNGTTAPAFGHAGGTTNNIFNYGSSPLRFGVYSSGLTALPASFTPSSAVNSGASFWAAVK